MGYCTQLRFIPPIMYIDFVAPKKRWVLRDFIWQVIGLAMLYEHGHKMILCDISASILFLTFMVWVNQWLSIAKRTEQNNDEIHGRLDRDDS